jgi:hypothetical protein
VQPLANYGGADERRPIERSRAMATAARVQPDAPYQGVLARHPLIFYTLMPTTVRGLSGCPFCSPRMVWASCRLAVRYRSS